MPKLSAAALLLLLLLLASSQHQSNSFTLTAPPPIHHLTGPSHQHQLQTKTSEEKYIHLLPPSSTMTMRIFDHARRHADETLINDMEFGPLLSETNLVPAPGSTHRKKRKGRGISAGQGATCGFGMRGQKSRSGNKKPRLGFEGGQTPLYRRIGKFVGKPPGPGLKRVVYNIIKVGDLHGFGVPLGLGLGGSEDGALEAHLRDASTGEIKINYEQLLALGRVNIATGGVPHKFVVGRGLRQVRQKREVVEGQAPVGTESGKRSFRVKLEPGEIRRDQDYDLNFCSNLVVQAHHFTKSAREMIEERGGRCEVLKRSTGEVMVPNHKGEYDMKQRWMRERKVRTRRGTDKVAEA